MPPVLLVFFMVLGAGAGLPVIGGLTKGVDPEKRPIGHYRCEQQFRAWTTGPTLLADENQICHATWFVVPGCGKPTRLQIGAFEQNLDTSYTFDTELAAGTQQSAHLTFLDPLGGAILATRDVSVRCYPWQPKPQVAVDGTGQPY